MLLVGVFLSRAGLSSADRRFLLSWLLGTSAVCAVAGTAFLAIGQANAANQLLAFAWLANLVNLKTATTAPRAGYEASARGALVVETP